VIADATPYPSKGRSETLKKTLLNTASKTLDLIESFRMATCPACHGYATEHLNKSGSFGRAIVRVLPATAKSHPAEATAPVDQPSPIFDDDADRRLLANFCLKEAKQPWEPGHPPQKHERAVCVHVVFTLLRFVLATAYRWGCEHEATGGLATRAAPTP
jgi:hypothetical protein